MRNRGSRSLALALLLSLYAVPAQGQAAQVQLLLDGRNLGAFPVVAEGGTLRLPLSAFAALGWRPLLDRYQNVIDLGGCLRLKTSGRDAFLIGGPATIGVRTVSQIEPLGADVQRRGGLTYLPAKSVLGFLQYAVTFDKAQARVEVRSPARPEELNPTQEFCLLNLRSGSGR